MHTAGSASKFGDLARVGVEPRRLFVELWSETWKGIIELWSETGKGINLTARCGLCTALDSFSDSRILGFLDARILG